MAQEIHSPPVPKKPIFALYEDENGDLWGQTGSDVTEFELYGLLKSYIAFLEWSINKFFLPEDDEE